MTLLLCCASLGQAKDIAELAGGIKDKSGAVVPGARIEISSFASKRFAISDVNGHFAFDGLPPGTYSVIVTKKNFKPAKINGLRLTTEKPVSIKLSLHSGRTEEFVTCDSAVGIDVSSSSVQRNIVVADCTNHSLDGIPRGRSVTDLF